MNKYLSCIKQRRCALLITVSAVSAGEQDEAGGFHGAELRGQGQCGIHVWHAGEAYPRVQTSAHELPARHHSLQPHQEEPQRQLRPTHSHDWWKGDSCCCFLSFFCFFCTVLTRMEACQCLQNTNNSKMPDLIISVLNCFIPVLVETNSKHKTVLEWRFQHWASLYPCNKVRGYWKHYPSVRLSVHVSVHVSGFVQKISSELLSVFVTRLSIVVHHRGRECPAEKNGLLSWRSRSQWGLWTAQPLATKLGMVVLHHGMKCNVEGFCCYLQDQGHSEGLYIIKIWLLLVTTITCEFNDSFTTKLVVNHYKPECPVDV